MQKERETERDLSSIVHSLNGHDGYGWAGPKPGQNQNFHLDLPGGCQDQCA